MKIHYNMKKNYYGLVAFLALAFGALAFSACEKNDSDDESSAKVEVPDTYDDLAYFQESIVQVDSLDRLLYYSYGEELYPNDPGHLYIGVDNITEAKDYFLDWIAPDVEMLQEGDAITCSLTDEEGNPQGMVYFTPGTGSTVADVVVSNGTRIRYFYKLSFILNSAWPYNSAESKWKKFDIVKNVTIYINKYLTDVDRKLNYVCIRESGNGVKPMFVTVTHDDSWKPGPITANFYKNDWGLINFSAFVPSLGKAKTISKILQKDWHLFMAVSKEADFGNIYKGCWIDHEHNSGSHFYDYVYYDRNPDDEKTWKYGAKKDEKVNCLWLFKIDWLDDSEIYDGVDVKPEHPVM